MTKKEANRYFPKFSQANQEKRGKTNFSIPLNQFLQNDMYEMSERFQQFPDAR